MLILGIDYFMCNAQIKDLSVILKNLILILRNIELFLWSLRHGNSLSHCCSSSYCISESWKALKIIKKSHISKQDLIWQIFDRKSQTQQIWNIR